MVDQLISKGRGALGMTQAISDDGVDGAAPPETRRTVRAHGPDPIDAAVGRKLRQARLLAGMSQEELGRGIGVSFQAVQKYEHGENRLSASRLFRAAQFLGRPVAFFFDELQGEAAPAQGAAFSRDEIELVRHYRQIGNDDVRENLLQVTRRIGGKAETAPAEPQPG
jgi:transcriptional regulator with XRE-family HTH domain